MSMCTTCAQGDKQHIDRVLTIEGRGRRRAEEAHGRYRRAHARHLTLKGGLEIKTKLG